MPCLLSFWLFSFVADGSLLRRMHAGGVCVCTHAVVRFGAGLVYSRHSSSPSFFFRFQRGREASMAWHSIFYGVFVLFYTLGFGSGHRLSYTHIPRISNFSFLIPFWVFWSCVLVGEGRVGVCAVRYFACSNKHYLFYLTIYLLTALGVCV